MTGLKTRVRTVVLFMDSITVREIPPLRAAWAPVGQQAKVPIIGGHGKRVLSAVLNLVTGTCWPYVSTGFNRDDFQAILSGTRALWRGWHIVLFLDKASAHTAGPSKQLAKALGIQLRWLPTACPELNVVDCLWRHVRDEVLANEPTPTLTATVQAAIEYLAALSGAERLTKAGVFSADFWLADIRKALMST